jgi:WD40 repeat protein
MQLLEPDLDYVQQRAAHFTGRGWVFARLDQFFHGPPGVFLLLGEPGTGKTAIAAQLALAAAGRLTSAAAGAAPHRAVPIAAAYFCRAREADLLDIAQRLSDQLAEAVPGFEEARRAILLSQIHVGDVQVSTGPVGRDATVAGIYIKKLRGLDGETAFRRAVTLPLKRVRETGEMTRVVLLVDALDESLASKAAKELPWLLGGIEDVHLVVTSRLDHRAIQWLRDRAERVNLLTDAPPGSDDVLGYLRRRLASEGSPAAMEVLSRRIAEHASGNFLYAFYVSKALQDARVLAGLDDAAARQEPLPAGGLPKAYEYFLGRELSRDARAWPTRFRPVLGLLAVAQDEGLTAEQLRLTADRLSEETVTRAVIRDVTRRASGLLDGPAPDGPFRMYHQSFANFLVDPAQNPYFLIDAAETHNAIVEAYADPLSWDDYARRNLAVHAAEAGRLDHLLEDARFLLAAEPSRLMPHLDAARSAPARAAAAVYRQSAHHLALLDEPARASQLELTARRLGYRTLAARIAAAAPDRPWQTRWSHGHRAVSDQIFRCHKGEVSAVAVGALPGGTPVIISASHDKDNTVQVWRLDNGEPVGKPLRCGRADVVATGALPGGTPVIVACGVSMFKGDTVRVWRLDNGEPVGEPLRCDAGEAGRVLATRALPDGTPVIITGSKDFGPAPDGTPVTVPPEPARPVRVWRLDNGEPVGKPLRCGRVDAVATGALPDGTPVIVTCSGSGFFSLGDIVRVWRLDNGEPVGEPPFCGHVDAMATGALPGGTPVIVTCSRVGGTVRVWRLDNGKPVGKPLRSERGAGLTAVAAGALPDGTLVIVAGGGDGTVQVWRLDNGGVPAGKPLRGHGDTVEAVATGALPDGTPVIISGSHDHTVRVWRLDNGKPVREPLRGHGDTVEAVATGALPGDTPVIISGSHDHTVRVWRLDNGEPVGEPLRGHGDTVEAVATGGLPNGTPVIITGGRTLEDLPPPPPPGSEGRVRDTLYGRDTLHGTVRVWRLDNGKPVGKPLRHHGDTELRFGDTVKAVATGALPDGTSVIISGSGNRGTVRVWRLDNGKPVGKPLRHHGDTVKLLRYTVAVAAGALPGGTPVIVSGGNDGTVRVWRLADGEPVGKPLRFGDTVKAVATGALPDGTPVIVAGGGWSDGTVRVWRLADGKPILPPLDLPAPVSDVAIYGDVIVIAAGADISVHQLPRPRLAR